MGRFFRQIVAPIAAAVATVFAGPLAGAAVYNQMAVFGANLERGRGFFESWGRGQLAGGATLFGGTIGGGAASAALTGQNPGRGALLGLVQGAAAAAGGALGTPANDFVAVAQSAAVGAASGAAGAAVVGGDPLKGAGYGAASAAAVTAALIAAGNIQAALDAGRARAGAEADAKISEVATGQSSGGATSIARQNPPPAAQTKQALVVNRDPFQQPQSFSNKLNAFAAEFNYNAAKLQGQIIDTVGSVAGEILKTVGMDFAVETGGQSLGIPKIGRTGIGVGLEILLDANDAY